MPKGDTIQRLLPSFFLVTAVLVSPAQNIIPNPSLESGTATPASWAVSGGGTWATVSRTGARSAALAPAPGLTPYWYSSAPIEGNRAYVVRFWARATNAVSGFCNGGFNTVSRDFTKPADYWQDFSMAAWVPTNGGPYFRCGFWNLDGTAYFDDAEVLPLNAVHKQAGAYLLGAGESVAAGRYVFQTLYAGYGANCARALHTANTSFDTSHWVMNTGAQVVYRHDLGGMSFSNAQVTCGIYDYFGFTGAVLNVEASTNGTIWQPVGSMASVPNGSLSLPAGLLPAAVVFIRLSGMNVPNGSYGLTNYVFSADIADPNTTAMGETHYFGDFMTNSTVRIAAAATTPAGHAVSLAIPNSGPTNKTFQIIAATTFSTNTRTRIVSVSVPAGSTNQASILLPTAGFGNNTCLLTVQGGAGTNIFQQDTTFNVSILTDDSYGERLPAPANTPVWWSNGDYKVGRSRYLPLATNTAVRITSARNEYEPFQLVLRPEVALSNVTASISDFVSTTNAAVTFSATNVTLCRVEYVNLTQLIAGENFSVTGEHPDPLVPLTAPFAAPAQTNSPLWFTIHVPKDASAGDYQADVTISSSAGTFTVPVRLQVFGFALTDVTHTHTAYGVTLQYGWHGLLNDAPPTQQWAVWDLYLENMARHRISPYFPQRYSQVVWGYNADNQTFHPSYASFDGPMERYLEEFNFTSFKDINDFYEMPSIPGVPAITNSTINPAYRPLYARLMQPVMQHLREKGWAERAYSFWMDEPQPAQFALFREGMKMVEETAPDLTRYLASFTGLEPGLVGAVDTWSLQMQTINTNTSRSRQAQGEQVWLYVCASPHAPWPNNFIDHPAVNPRARAWLGDHMGMTGEEYYGINYYLGTTNVWTSPMSCIDPTSPGNYNWGNGDGTLVYPPTKEKPPTPLIAGPFDSVRWEMTREAQEDREYFWSLNRVLAVREPLLGTNHPAILEARAAKAAAMSLVSLAPADLYPYEPAKFHNVRLRLGAAIEALENGAPFVAKQPLSKVALVGATETLRVEAAGWPLPAIQWRRAGTNLPGATTDKLVLTNLSFNFAGDYTAVLSNSSGTVTSAVGKITVYDAASPPQIVVQPAALICTNGARVVFGVGASSVSAMSYQWYLEGVPLAGATGMTLVLTNAASTNAGYYSVVVNNGAGATTSVPTALYVVPPGGSTVPVITAQPVSQIRLPGQAAQFSASVVGLSPMGYQWYFNTNTLLVGETVSTLSLTSVQASHAGAYTLRITNFAGTATSAPARLQIATMPHYTNERPVYALAGNGSDFRLSLAPDNRLRTVLTSTNLRDWTLLYTAAPSTMPLTLPVGVNNEPFRFFRLQASLQSPAMPNYTNQRPDFTGVWLGSDYLLTLAPDNRPRSVLASTNMRDWILFYSAAPSALPESIPTAADSARQRFFRLLAAP